MGNSFAMLMDGFQTAFTPTNLMFGLLGTFLGTLVGVLPGIGPASSDWITTSCLLNG